MLLQSRYMTAQDLIAFWLNSAKDDLETAEGLFKLKKYHHCLFFCHLCIEKMLKGLIFKNTKKYSPPIHDLEKLAVKAAIALDIQLKMDLGEMTTWNIRARYDDYKRVFYKKATKEFTNKWLSRTKEIFQWLKKQY